jgi:hypothetical protein
VPNLEAHSGTNLLIVDDLIHLFLKKLQDRGVHIYLVLAAHLLFFLGPGTTKRYNSDR